MGTTATMGHQGKLGIGLTAPTTKRFRFRSSTLTPMQSLIEDQEINGSRSEFAESVVPGIKRPGGTIVLEPRPDDLPLLMQICMGGTPSGNTIPLAETQPSFYIDHAWGTTAAQRFSGCRVSRWSLSSRKDEKLVLSMDVLATDWSDITFPTISFSTEVPYSHHQSTLSLRIRNAGGAYTSYTSPEWSLEGDNALDGEHHENSATRTEMPEGRRQIRLGMDSPYVDGTKTVFDIYGSAGVLGLEGTLAWVNGADSLTFAMAALQKAGEGPRMNDDLEIRLPIVFACRETVSTKELICTNVDA